MSDHQTSNTLFKPPMTFSFKSSGTEQSTFLSRFIHFQQVVDPRNFFLTPSSINRSIDLVSQLRKLEESTGKPLQIPFEESEITLRSVRIYNSAIHSDTKE